MANEISIENLSPKVDASALSSTFKKEGRILSCSIEVDKHFDSLGKGYIVFDNPSSAHNAVKTMNGQKLQGGIMKVSLKHKDDDDDNIDAYMKSYTKIYIKHIPETWDDYDLMREFSKFGEIGTAQVNMTDGKSNGYGFVIFNNHTSAKKAVMNNKHPQLEVKPFIPKPIRSEATLPPDSPEDILKKGTQYNNLHVKNIPEGMDDDELKELFEEFGDITSAIVAKDKNSGKSLQYGFVCFDTEEEASEARSVMDGRLLSSKPLIVSFYQNKHARKKYFEKKNSKKVDCEEKGIKEKVVKENVEKGKIAKEKVAKEKVVKEKVAKEKVVKEKVDKEKVIKSKFKESPPKPRVLFSFSSN